MHKIHISMMKKSVYVQSLLNHRRFIDSFKIHYEFHNGNIQFFLEILAARIKKYIFCSVKLRNAIEYNHISANKTKNLKQLLAK